MRTRIMTMLAALLLISTGAFAQSGETPLKGDVNEDGKVDVADINAVIKIMKDAGGTAEETKYYFYLGNNENQVISNDYTINTSLLQTYNNVEDILGNHTFDSAQYVLVPEVWYYQIKFKNAQNMPLDADVYRVNIGTTNYILIEGYESWADLLVLELDPNNQGGLDAEIVDKTNYQEIYYWYVGTTPIDDTNYNDTNIVSQVSTIPAETTITTNDEYFYIVVPKEKNVTVIDVGTNFELGTETYNSSTHTFTNAETYVGDYAIYRSTQTVYGTSKITITE